MKEGEAIGVISERDFLSHMRNKKTKSFMNIITHSIGYLYVLIPAGLGAVIMLLALLVNNNRKIADNLNFGCDNGVGNENLIG